MENVFNIQEIFKDKIFRVPDYQRNYSWEEEQCRDLIEDLEELPLSKKHYTGTLIFHVNNDVKNSIMDETGNTISVYNIVDGQQRLTSIVILLQCIAEIFKEELSQRGLYSGIRKNYVMFIDNRGKERARLILNKHCNDYFFNNIITDKPEPGGPKIYAHKLLNDAKNFFKHYLVNKLNQEQDKESYLLNLHKKIINGLEFNIYKVKEETDVGVIFEVMNNRGKPLTELEKVKNYLIYLAKMLEPKEAEELDEEINNVWSEILENIMEAKNSSGDVDEDQLLRFSWLMAYDPEMKNWKQYKSVKEKFNLKDYKDNHNKLIKDISEYIKLLKNACKAYCDIVSPNRANAFEEYRDIENIRERLIKKSVKLIRIGNISPFLPILVALRLKYPREHDVYEKVLELLEKYAFRIFRLQERRSNTGQSFLIRRGFELFNSELLVDELIYKITKRLLEYSPEREYLAAFELGKKNWYNFSGLKYFLYEYEESLAGNKKVQLPWEDIHKKDREETIEHILPQCPDLPYWKERWTPEQINQYLHDIGNLVLTYDNSSYCNKSFPEKKGIPGRVGYSNSNLFQERALASWSDWTEKELLERRQEIVNWAIKRWWVEPISDDEKDLIEDDYDVENEINKDESEDEQEMKMEWKQEEIHKYLNRLRDGNLIRTFNYYRALALSQNPLSFSDLIKKISELTGKKITGRAMAGIWSGLTKSYRRLNKERLDILDNKKDQYYLDSKYRNMIIDYFNREK